jgi:CHAT domain-containing protein
MYFLYESAMLHSMNGKHAAAISDLKVALSYAREWREAIAPSDSMRSGAEFWLKQVYDAYIDLTTRQNNAVDSFLAVEEERSASLLQTLAESAGSPRLKQFVTPEYRENLARLRLLEIARLATPKAHEVQTAQVLRQLAETEAQVSGQPNHLKNAENFPILSTLRGVQKKIRPEEAILGIHLGTASSWLWGVTADHIEMHRLRPRRAIVGIAETFRNAVRDSSADRDRIGAALYKALFGRLSQTVIGKRRWIFTCDDELFEVPFAALTTGFAKEEKKGAKDRIERAVYLVERHETFRIPSAFALSDAPSVAASGPFLALGDGIYNSADQRWNGPRESSRHSFLSALFGFRSNRQAMELPRLVSSSEELKLCASAWHASGAPSFLTGYQLSLATLVPALRLRPAVVHIAAHVLYPSGKPSEALIHLGLAPDGSPEVLTTKDVSSLHAEGALVVLSGCSSAAVNSMRGVGVMGLTRAWLLAGARAVVGSRWPVADDSGDLFRAFYKNLAPPRMDRPGLSFAFQQARLEMLRSGQWRSDPHYWGAYYLLGEN